MSSSTTIYTSLTLELSIIFSLQYVDVIDRHLANAKPFHQTRKLEFAVVYHTDYVCWLLSTLHKIRNLGVRGYLKRWLIQLFQIHFFPFCVTKHTIQNPPQNEQCPNTQFIFLLRVRWCGFGLWVDKSLHNLIPSYLFLLQLFCKL